MWMRLLKFCTGVLAIVTLLYSALVGLMIWDGLAPAACQASPICSSSPVTMPSERFGVAMVVGVNSLLVGGLWWAIVWGVDKVRSGSTTGTLFRALRNSAHVGCWMYLSASAVSLFVPWLFAVFWAVVLFFSAIATVPAILYLLWKNL